MVIQIDSREKERAIKNIVSYFDSNGIKHYTSKLFAGDYMNMDNPKIIVDRKQNLAELVNNVTHQHARFKAEIIRANDVGILLVFLCEHGGQIKTLQDVMSWKNPRLKESPLAMSGERLFKVLSTMEKTYNIKFQFCDKKQTGKRIVEILNGESTVSI